MRRKIEAPGEVTIPHDPVNEQVVLAAALAGGDSNREELLRRLAPDTFFAPQHSAAWAGLGEMGRRKLGFDLATLQKVAPGVDVEYLAELMLARPGPPPNLEFHVSTMIWDYARLTAARGPIASLIDAVRDPTADPDRVRSLSRQVAMAFDDYQDLPHLRTPEELVREQVAELRARAAGIASYSYGIDRLDYYEAGVAGSTLEVPVRRCVPGPAPGQVTLITGVPGGGKSTVAARIALGLARNGRRVLFGAWEQKGGTTLELIACMSLGLSRTRAQLPTDRGGFCEEEIVRVHERMEVISRHIRFLALPFNRRMKERPLNDRNLDIVQSYIAASGCDVFIADLWKRCLVNTKPEDEELALIRQQAMAEELRVHCILVQQQRLKDIEQRPDKRPTREGIKGSGAWVEVADTIIGVHRRALWKDTPDNVLELDYLKQRYGKWPIAVEFDWDADTGLIAGGRTVPYDNPGATSAGEASEAIFGGRKKRR